MPRPRKCGKVCCLPKVREFHPESGAENKNNLAKYNPPKEDPCSFRSATVFLE